MAVLLDGKALSLRIQNEIKASVAAHFSPATAPKLSIILVGSSPASLSYVGIKTRTAERLGFKHELYHFSEDATSAEIEARIDLCNADPDCDALFVQLPLPKHLDGVVIPNRVRIDKDADGLTRNSMGALLLGEEHGFMPCTPKGMMRLLDAYDIPIAGREAVVIGRSNIVGKPISLMLQKRNATVTMCHTKTVNLEAHVKRADILVIAAGVPELVHGSWLKPGVAIIDAGFTKLENGRISGDLHFESAHDIASYITPVPGGVGPMTVAMLMEQCLHSALKRINHQK